jgi:hypothetical protein
MSQRKFVNEKTEISGLYLGEAANVGDVCAISEWDNNIYPACAAGGTTRALPAVGVLFGLGDPEQVRGGRPAGAVTLNTKGLVYDDSVTLKAGAPVYVSDTPGVVSATAGTVTQIVGIAVGVHEWLIGVIPIAEDDIHGSS